MASGVNPYGDGCAAERVVGALEYFLGVRDDRPADYDWRQAR
jgi:UDP-N-acetylglucosamine 2-epimerase